MSGAALIADETIIAVQSVAVTKILVPQDQPAGGTLAQAPFATPNDVAVDDARALFITNNARAGAEGFTIFQQGTNVKLAQTNIDNACLQVALPGVGGGSTPCLTVPTQGWHPVGLTLNPGTAPPETGSETGETSGSEGAEVAPPVMLYQVLQHSGLKWSGLTAFETTAPDDPAEASLLLEYDITDPQNPVLKNGFLLGHGAHQAAVNAGTGLVFAGNNASSPSISVINPLYAAGTNPYLFIDLPAGDAVEGIGLPAAGAEAGGSAFAVTHTSGKIYAFDAGCAASGSTCIQYAINANSLFPEGAPHMHNVAVGTLSVYATVNAIGDAALADDAPSLTQGQSIVVMPLPAEEATVDPATVTLSRFDLPNVNAHGVAVDDTRNLLFVSGERTGNLAVVDATTGTLRQTLPISIPMGSCTVPAGVLPNVQAVQVDPTTGNAYVTDAGQPCLYESVSVVSPDANEPIRIASFSTNLSAPQDPGASIDVSAFATGGAGAYEYKFFAFDGTTWSVIRDWGTANTFTWTAANASRIGVWARAAGSTTDAPGSAEATVSMDFAVGVHAPLTITDISHDPIHPQIANTAITLTAVTANVPAAGVEYKWFVYDGGTWTVLSDWSSSSTFTWTPASANAAYRVGVWARAAGSTTDAPENSQAMFSTEFPVIGGSVLPLVISSFTADKTGPQAIGTPITFTAAAVNGAAEFKFWLFDGATWTPAGDWSATNTFVWTPTAGNPNARVGVWARTAGSTVDAPADPLLSTASMAFPVSMPLPLTVTTILSDTRLPTHSNVTITFTTATANAAGPLQYKYWLYDGQAWYVVQDWSTNASFAWTPDIANLNYRIGVWVRTVGNTTDAPETDSALYSMTAPIQTGGL